MKEQEIVPWDVKRILLGQAPAAFLLERGPDRDRLVSLAAAISPAMQTPDRGLLPKALVALFVVGMQRARARAAASS